MPDKDYIRKIYNFMDSAYGKSGAVQKGAFGGNGGFDGFYNRITSDAKYADKVYGALNIAYGPDGAYRRNAFSLKPDAFLEKVSAQPEQLPIAKEFLQVDSTPPQAEHPAVSVLSSGMDLSMPETKPDGYLKDISAFEPAIQAEEDRKRKEVEETQKKLNEYITRPIPPSISMTPLSDKEAIDQQFSNPNIQMQHDIKLALDKIDQEDKNRLASQAVADEIYKTPQGRLYYDFIRPIYKTALEAGKNTAAFGARLFNADKTADKLVDYFDFDRLAKEGNPSAPLSTEPSQQKGRLGINNIIPRAVEAVTNMGMLMGGSAALGGGKAALLGSSFAMQYESYRQAAKQSGLSDAEADKYAITGAGINSALELVSPNSLILKDVPEALTKKEVFNAIKDGIGIKTAIKKAITTGGSEVLKENMQELAQSIGDNAVKYTFDKYILDDPRFNQESILPSAREALETIVLTTIATGVTAAAHIRAKSKPPALERSAWATAAENPEIINNGVKNAVAQGQLTPDAGEKIRQSVEEYRQIYTSLTQRGMAPGTAERVTMNAIRSKKLDESSAPLKGVEALNSITAEDDKTKLDIEKDILDAMSGQQELDYNTDDAAPLRQEQSQDERAAIQELFESGAPTEKILSTVTNLVDDKFIKSQADLLKPYLSANPEIKFSKMFSVGRGEAHYTGDWTVLLSNIKNKEDLSHVVVHELYHVISMNELANNSGFEQKIQSYIDEARKQLGVENYFSGTTNTDFGSNKDVALYGLLDPKEFIAEIFSNKEFSDKIDNIKFKSEDKSILQKFIDLIKKAIGAKEKSSSQQIRDAILKGINTKINFNNDEVVKTISDGYKNAARQADFVYQPLNQPLGNYAIQEQSPAEMDVRQQAENGEGVGERNIQPEITPQEVEQASQEEVAPAQVGPEMSARDTARTRLKSAWDAYKTTGIISDPRESLKRDTEFYSALANYVKEEILYRANQVKGFAQQKKAKIKKAIVEALKSEGIALKDLDMLNDAFEDAYSQVRSIPGVINEEITDRIGFKQYIKDRIQVREAGFKKGVKSGEGQAADRVKSVRGAILETLNGAKVNLSMPQKRSLLTMLKNAATSKDVEKSVERAVNVTTQMIWEAKNKQKIADAKKLIKSIQKMKRSKSMVLQDVEWIKGLSLPAPSKVDDLDSYIEMLRDFYQSRKGNELNPKHTKEEISEFVDQENARIYQERMSSMRGTLDDLKAQGVIPEDVSFDEYIAMLDADSPKKSNEGISPKSEILKNSLKQRLHMLEDRLGEFDGEDKSLVSELTKVDPEYLSAVDLIRLNNVLNNISEFGTLDAAGDIVTTFRAKKGAEALAASGDKIRELPSIKVLNRKNLSNFMSALFYNDNAISNFRQKTIGAIEQKVSRVKNTSQNVVREFVKLTKDSKIDGLGNNKLHAFSYLNQYRGNDPGEIADDLKSRVDDLVSDAKYIFDEAQRIEGAQGKLFQIEALNRLDALKDLGLIDYTVEESGLDVEVLGNFNEEDPTASLQQIEGRLSEGERAVYSFAREHYDALTDRLEDVTRQYAGKEFQRERNYISLVPRKKRVAENKEPDISADTDIMQGLKSVNSRPSSTTLSRSHKKPEDVYYDSDFFSNFVNRYYSSLYTAEVLPELQTVAKTVNDPEFEKFLTGQFDEGFRGLGRDNFQKFKAKLAEAINEEKYSPYFKKGKGNILDEVVSRGVRLVLGNIWQGPKQYVPALLHNLAINDANAIRYAIASRAKALSPSHKEYAEARKGLLNHFTGVQRSAVGSNAYDGYIKRIGDDMSWWQHPLEWLDKVGKISSFVLEKADKAAQADALIGGYITSLIRDKKIKSIEDFDIYEHAKNPDKKALAYAEQVASNINNESAKAYRPAVLKDPTTAKYLWLLQGFSLNAYQNAMNKAKIVFDNRATNAEKKEAALHFLGYLGELSAYQLVGKWSRNLQGALAVALLYGLFGIEVDEDEEKKKQKEKKENIRMLANTAADISMSGLPAPFQSGLKMLVNYAYGKWAASEVDRKKEEAKQQGKKFNPKGTYLSPYFKPYVGAEGPGGAAEFYTSAGKKIVDYVADSAKEGKDLSPEKARIKNLMDNLNKYLGIPATVIGSGDLMILNARMQQALKDAKVDDPQETSSGTGPSARRTTRSVR